MTQTALFSSTHVNFGSRLKSFKDVLVRHARSSSLAEKLCHDIPCCSSVALSSDTVFLPVLILPTLAERI